MRASSVSCLTSLPVFQAELRVLDLSNNQIPKLQGIEVLHQLEELWVRVVCPGDLCAVVNV